MPNNNLTTLPKAFIQMLFEAARAAIGLKDAATYDYAVRQLDVSSQDIALPAQVRDLAAKCHDELGDELVDDGMATLKELVKDLGNATGELKQAMARASADGERLFFPAIADAAAQALSSFEELQASAGKVKDDVAKGQLGALRSDLATLSDSLKTHATHVT